MKGTTGSRRRARRCVVVEVVPIASVHARTADGGDTRTREGRACSRMEDENVDAALVARGLASDVNGRGAIMGWMGLAELRFEK